MKFRLSLLATAILVLFAPFAHAQTFCNQTIIDQAHVIGNPQVVANAASTLINQGADVHVVTVNSASFAKYGQLAGVESYLESQCPNWTTNGVRKANLFVVMVAPNDRAKNMFLGSNYAGAFDIPSTYSQLSNSFFKNGNFGGGLAAALQGTTNQALNFQKRQFQAQQQRRVTPQQRTSPSVTYVPSSPNAVNPTQDADSGISGLAIFFIVLLVLGAAGTLIYLLVRRSNSSSTTTTSYDSTDPGYVSTPSYGSRSYAARAGSGVSHTTIIDNSRYDSNGNLLTGVLLGEALSRNNNPNPTNVYVNPSPTYVDPTTPSYVPDAAPVPDAPDSSWEQTSQQQDTSFEAPTQETTSFEAPSQPDTSFSAPDPSPDFGSSNDFGSSSGGDTGF